MISVESKIRVRYGETDRMGFLYYGYYPLYFEVARTEMIRMLGITYRQMEDMGILLPVRSLNVQYRNPAEYDDLLMVTSAMKTYPNLKLDIDYVIKKENGMLVCTGNTVLVFLDAQTRKLCKAPDFFLKAVEPYFSAI